MTNDVRRDPVDRRAAIKRLACAGGIGAAAVAGGLFLSRRSRRPEDRKAPATRRAIAIAPDPSLPEICVARGDDPRAITRAAVDALGGMRRFVSPGETVLIKPNIGWDREPEQAANTNPEVIAELARLCRDAGAARVLVTDVSCNEPQRCFQRSGIAAAAGAEGAVVVLPEQRLFRDADVGGETIARWPVLEPFLTADKVINVPVAKHHSLTGVTLGMKNWYGILGGLRQRLHQRIDESVVDLAAFMRPALTVIDAYRVLARNGPTGGNVEDVVLSQTVIAGTDPVALDACAARTFWKLDAAAMPYLAIAGRRGLGRPDFSATRMRTMAV